MGPEGHCESLGGVDVTAPASNDCCSFFAGGGGCLLLTHRVRLSLLSPCDLTSLAAPISLNPKELVP